MKKRKLKGQLDLFGRNGKDLKEDGMERVRKHTPDPYKMAFQDVAYSFPHGHVLRSENITAVVGQPPNHPNAVGALMSGLAKRGVIEHIEGAYAKAHRIVRHAGESKIWRRK